MSKIKFFVMVVYVLLSVAGVTCFKLGSTESLNVTVSNTYFSIRISWLSILGLMLYAISFLIYMGLISKSYLSYLLPIITGMVYILTLLAAVVIFKEKLQFGQIVGSVLILIGVVLMNIKIK